MGEYVSEVESRSVNEVDSVTSYFRCVVNKHNRWGGGGVDRQVRRHTKKKWCE